MDYIADFHRLSAWRPQSWGIDKLTRGRGPTLLTQAVLHELGLRHTLKFIWDERAQWLQGLDSKPLRYSKQMGRRPENKATGLARER